MDTPDTSMAEATPAQIEANPTEASPSAKETTTESHSSKVNEQPLTPTIKDKPSLEHVAQKDETELRASVMEEGKRVKAELAQMQRETANLKKTLNKKTRVLKEAHALLGETVIIATKNASPGSRSDLLRLIYTNVYISYSATPH